MLYTVVQTQASGELINDIVVVVAVILTLIVIGLLFRGVMVIMLVGLIVLTYMAAWPYKPDKPPEPFALPQEVIHDSLWEGGSADAMRAVAEVVSWEVPFGPE